MKNNVQSVSIHQAASYLKVSIKTMRRWLKDGALVEPEGGFTYADLDAALTRLCDTESDVWLSAGEACSRLGIPHAQLFAHAKSGRLPTYKLPGAGLRANLRFRSEDIKAFIEKSVQQTP